MPSQPRRVIIRVKQNIPTTSRNSDSLFHIPPLRLKQKNCYTFTASRLPRCNPNRVVRVNLGRGDPLKTTLYTYCKQTSKM